MRGLGTDHVISGPMRRLGKKTASNGADRQTDRQTDGHGDFMTESSQKADSVKIVSNCNNTGSLLRSAIIQFSF